LLLTSPGRTMFVHCTSAPLLILEKAGRLARTFREPLGSDKEPARIGRNPVELGLTQVALWPISRRYTPIPTVFPVGSASLPTTVTRFHHWAESALPL